MKILALWFGLIGLCSAEQSHYVAKQFNLSPPTCSIDTPNVRPPKCVDYNRIYKRPPLCSVANPGIVPPNCSAVDVPDSTLTPGSNGSDDLNTICGSTYLASHPDASTLTSNTTQQVYVNYQFPYKRAVGPCVGGCVLDNLIPIGLGGTNDLTNLWPQPMSGTWDVDKKNTLETVLRSRVCTVTAPHTSSVSIGVARAEIAANWKAAYTKYVTNQQ